MRFKIERTTEWDDDVPPCEGATRGTIPRWDRRTCTAAEFDRKDLGRGHSWYDVGSEHQKMAPAYNGDAKIKRRMEDEPAWFIEVDGLAGLMAFQEKYGDLVIKTSDGDESTPCIEIYDGYRE